MQRAKTFFYVSLGILAIALSFHLGASTDPSQSSSAVVAAVAESRDGGYMSVITQNGDVWECLPGFSGQFSHFVGNVFAGAPVPTKVETWGRIKADRR